MRSFRWLRWDRADQMFLEAVLWLVPGLGVLSLVPLVTRAMRGEPIELAGPLPAGLLRSGAPVKDPTGTVVLAEPTAGQQALALVGPVLAVVAAAVGAMLLLGVVRALRAGDPFTPASTRRLMLLALLVTVAGMTLQWVNDAVRNTLLRDVPGLGGEPPVVFELSFWPVLAGIVIAFVAEVFTRGVVLRADVEGLV